MCVCLYVCVSLCICVCVCVSRCSTVRLLTLATWSCYCAMAVISRDADGSDLCLMQTFDLALP